MAEENKDTTVNIEMTSVDSSKPQETNVNNFIEAGDMY